MERSIKAIGYKEEAAFGLLGLGFHRRRVFLIVRGEVLLIRVEDLFSLEIFYSSTCNLSIGTHISFPFSVFCIFHP